MASRMPMSYDVEVFMTQEEALYAVWERGDDSQHGSSSEGTVPMTLLSERAMSSARVGPSGRGLELEDVETKDLGSVKSRGDGKLVEQGK